MQAIIGERIGQRLDDMGLADQLLEPPRPPFARQNRVTHAQVSGNERSAPARPRHPTGLLPLLPSGPDGVYSWLSRGNRRGPSLLYQLGFGPCDSTPAPFVYAFRSGLRCPPCALGATRKFGEMAEWLKAHAWKVCIRPKGVSRVRIPLSPPRST